MTPVPARELGDVPPLDDAGAWETLRGRMARHIGVREGEVLPLLGTTHALFTAYASLVSPGEDVLVEHPSYEPMYRIAEGLGARPHTMNCPPLAESVEPVMRPASSEARNSTQRATSSGSPSRPIGIRGRIDFSSTSFGTACTISVLM